MVLRGMRKQLLLLALALGLGGCSDDVCTICERTADCVGWSESQVEECVEEVEKQNISDDALSSCADCLDDKSCGEIADQACQAACASAYYMVGG